MKYDKARGLHIGQRRTDGRGGNAVLTPNPQRLPTARDAAIDASINRGLSTAPLPTQSKLKDIK